MKGQTDVTSLNCTSFPPPLLLQAEARRRSRINERLEALRRLVPHTRRANTANFLEECAAYVHNMHVSELLGRRCCLWGRAGELLGGGPLVGTGGRGPPGLLLGGGHVREASQT